MFTRIEFSQDTIECKIKVNFKILMYIISIIRANVEWDENYIKILEKDASKVKSRDTLVRIQTLLENRKHDIEIGKAIYTKLYNFIFGNDPELDLRDCMPEEKC